MTHSRIQLAFSALLFFGSINVSGANPCPDVSISNSIVAASIRGNVRELEKIAQRLTAPGQVNCPSYAGHLPINQAIIKNRRNAVQWLLDNGVNTELRGPKRRLPLITATAFQHYYQVRALLLAGANPDGRDTAGRTALHHAAEDGNARLTALLLQFEADPEVIDRQNRTPLMLAVELGQIDVVEALLDANAGTSRTDLQGRTALDIAQQFKLQKIAKLLEARKVR